MHCLAWRGAINQLHFHCIDGGGGKLRAGLLSRGVVDPSEMKGCALVRGDLRRFLNLKQWVSFGFLLPRALPDFCTATVL